MEHKQVMAKPGQYLTFTLQGRHFAVPIETVKEINRMGDITPVPQTPQCVAGVMNLRGKVIPVVDLRLKFGVEPSAYTRETCIIVIEGVTGAIGTIVDSVSDVAMITESHLEPPPVLHHESDKNFVVGVGKLDERVVLLVDVVNALDAESVALLPEQGKVAA